MRIRLALFAVLLACAGEASAADLRVGVASEPTYIDPHAQELGVNIDVRMHIFDSLVRIGDREELLPGLAESWRLAEAPLVWEFKLRAGAVFHDGAPVTAEDAAFSIARAPAVPGAPSTYSRHLRSIDKVEVVDALTLRVRTKMPNPLLPANLAHIAVVDRRIGPNAAPSAFLSGAAANGTGPYRFVEFVPGERLVLQANPRYWGPKPRWDRVTFRALKTPAARLAALLTGEVDAISEVPTNDVEKLSHDKRFVLSKGVSNRIMFWAMDTSRETTPFATARDGKPIANPFRDKRVREAVALVIDKPALVDRLMEGLAVVANQIPLEGHNGYIANLNTPKADLPRARKLMAEAGYADGFKLTIHTTNGRYVNDVNLAQAVAQMLSRLNIEVSVQPMQVATYFTQARNREFTFLQVGWGHSSTDPLLVMRETFHSKAANNYGSWSNATVDRLLDTAETELDFAKRQEEIAEVTRISNAEAVIVPTHYQVNVWVSKRGIRYVPRRDETTLADNFRAE
ncbi:MAG: ABC transporter substrate-binding protein [Alphaproteobacteria bacterium]|nr:ABC transporter substrate-binding protein [Alphaproteobacteria bacterium]